MPSLRVAVDVGGTFTDVCIVDEDTRDVRVTKVPSTPDDPMRAVVDGVKRGEIDLSTVALFSHGTTVATNALITRRFPKAAMVTTSGFRDVLEIRDGTKDDLWDAYKDVGGPYIRRRDRFEVTERIDYSGQVVEPLDEVQAREIARLLKKRQVETVAVCFVNSYANPAHETRMREILAEELPGVNLCTSAEILPEIFEYERFNTTAANAVLAPLVTGYVDRLSNELATDGYDGDLLLLHSGGGSMTPRMVDRFPVRLAASGIAAGAIAARHLAVQSGYPNAIGLDMGGTSTDICLVHNGELRVTKEWSVEYGYPIIFPSIEVLTIGAGGGSLAWLDEAGVAAQRSPVRGRRPRAGLLRHRRHAADEQRRQRHPRPTGHLAGRRCQELRPDLAREAISGAIAQPLGLGLEEAAGAIVKVANANMSDAVRLVSIRRGLDPRDFALIAFGGAGALHGAEVARELGIPTVLVPPNPGVTSALGCLLVDIRHDLSLMYNEAVSEADREELEAKFTELEDEAVQRLRHEGVGADETVLQRQISMRYLGQWRSLAVEIGRGPGSLDEAVQRFHEQHEQEFAYRRDDAPVEIYQIALEAIGTTPKPAFVAQPRTSGVMPEPKERRRVWFESTGWVDTPVYDRDELPPGSTFPGPAVIDQLDSTTVVPPGCRAEIDEWLMILIHLTEA